MTWLHCRPPTRGTQVKDKEAEAAAATAAASARGGREKDLPVVRVFCRGLGGGGRTGGRRRPFRRDVPLAALSYSYFFQSLDILINN